VERDNKWYGRSFAAGIVAGPEFTWRQTAAPQKKLRGRCQELQGPAVRCWGFPQPTLLHPAPPLLEVGIVAAAVAVDAVEVVVEEVAVDVVVVVVAVKVVVELVAVVVVVVVVVIPAAVAVAVVIAHFDAVVVVGVDVVWVARRELRSE
jgi:hypothetical protein